MRNPFLIGSKVYLRPPEREDAPTFAAWFNDPEVRRTIHRQQPMSVRAEEEFIDKVARDEQGLVLVIVLRETDRPVGVTGLREVDLRNRHASFGITIGVKEEWGKGYGTEATKLIVRHAFETLNLNRVWLEVLEDNTRGIRAYERAGFRKEGVLRQHIYCAGRYRDLIRMAVLRSEWPAPPG